MAIETMIIFIAIVLIGAVTAGLLIRTSGTMQQRAISVSDEARERMITGIDVINMVANSDTDEQTINEFEFLVRLKAGSYPVQIKDLNLLFTTSTYTESATLSHYSVESLFEPIDISNIYNGTNSSFTWSTIPNIEVENSKDLVNNEEKIFLFVNESGNEEIWVNLSYASYNLDQSLKMLNYDVEGTTFKVNLENDLGNITGTGKLIEINNAPIKHPVSGNVYGYITIKGNAIHNNSLVGLDAKVTQFQTDNECEFNNLIPNTKFCIITRNGKNQDTKMEKGELYSIKFKVKEQQVISPEELIEIKLIPKGGSIETISVVTPAVFVLQTTTLWG